MTIDIEINNIEGKVLTHLSKDQLSVISDKCSFKVEGSDFKAAMFKAKTRGKCNWDGTKRLFNAQTRKFPVGLLHRVSEIFRQSYFDVNIIDKRVHLPAQTMGKFNGREPREYQRNVVITSLMHGIGTVKAATGSGKTVMAAQTIHAIGKKAVFIVHTKDLLYQTKAAFEDMFGCEIGQIGDGVVDTKFVTVATVQSLSYAFNVKFDKYKYDEEYDTIESFDMSADKKREILTWACGVGTIIFDEVQNVCSRTASGVRFSFVNADYAFGYSASPWRDDGSDMMIEGAFGPIICDVPASMLIDQGYLVQPHILIKSVPRVDDMGDKATYESVYRRQVVENTFRNHMIINDALEHYNLGRSVLILVTQIKHGEILEKMIRDSGNEAIFISGRNRSKYRNKVIDDMRSGKSQLIIATTIADVGLDVPRLNTIIEAGAGKSSVIALQRVGRIMRKFPGKDVCWFHTYRDNAPYLYKQVDNKIRIWRTEPRFVIEEV